MDYILDKYVSPRVSMTLGFSSLRRQRGDGGLGKLFRRALARRKLVFRLVELVNQSEERNCEDVRVIGMMCIAKMAGVWCSHAFFAVLQASTETVCA